MDTALPDEQRTAIDTVLGEFSTPDVMFLRCAKPGSRAIRFVQMHACARRLVGAAGPRPVAGSGSESHLEAAVDDLFDDPHRARSATPRLRGLAVGGDHLKFCRRRPRSSTLDP